MNFFIGDHEVQIKPGFLKQRIWVDGKKVPKKYLNFTVPSIFVNTVIDNERDGNRQVEVYQRDRFEFDDGKLFLNGHEFEFDNDRVFLDRHELDV